MDTNDLVLEAVNASILAGKEIMKIYATDFSIEKKEDDSPLTLADKNANRIITSYLKETQIPILIKEGGATSFEERRNWKCLWIVDPLDGTKEFIKRNGEFTVNIALIMETVPVAGVIYVPVERILYFTQESPLKAYMAMLPENQSEISDLDSLLQISSELPGKMPDKYTAVGSRSHMSPETSEYFEKLQKEHGDLEVISMGSSLKICLVAEGKAHEYPRFAPTMEWDVAAGHAIAKAAGKELLDMETGKPMVYNRQRLLNNWFLVK